MSRWSPDRLRRLLVVAGALAGALVLVGAAWALDMRAHEGKVVRNITLAGRSVDGTSRAELIAIGDEIAGRYDRVAIEVRAPEAGFGARADELGVSVDRDRTVEAALAEGREGSVPARIWGWARRLVTGDRRARVALRLDQAAVTRVVVERDPARVAPVEPLIAVRDGQMAGVAGRPGRQIDPASIVRGLERADLGREPVVVEADRALVPPRFSREHGERLAARAEELARNGFKVVAGPQEAAVPAELFRKWVKAVPADDGLRLAAETATIADDLMKVFPKPVVAPVDAGFAVNGGSVVVTPAKSGSGCCAAGAVEAVAASINDPAVPQPVRLPLRDIAAKRDEAAVRRLGISQSVGTFTTSHAGGEPRVRNIHRMADLLRGTVIEPGQTFSINNTVGPRTADKGFVEAPIIGAENRFDAGLGGGVSQFATTMFNAAFFAGLEIPEYQMHGLYISRYPYGREATLSHPRPDLKVRNNSPYGVLVWPTYTGTSITVTLYSTKWVAEVTQSNQTKAEKGPCTLVTTERTRKFLDDRTVVDRFTGLYAPEEGVKCV